MAALCFHQIDQLFSPCTSEGLSLFHSAPSDRIWHIPKAVGTGYIQEIELSQGLSVVILDYELTQDFCQSLSLFRPSLEFEFCLTGHHSNTNLTILHLGECKPLDLPARERNLWVEVFVTAPRLEPYFYGLLKHLSPRLRELAENYIKQLNHQYFGDRLLSQQILTQWGLPDTPVKISQATEADWQSELWLEFEPVLRGKTTSSMQTILHQILHCPYHSMSRQLYLESKALELIALRFEQIAHLSQSLPPSRAMSSEDIQKIHQAREILRLHLKQPPSLIALARQVGLNDCTLKRGFRQIYGMTAFECLYHDRMQQAQHLLEAGEMAIKQVAAAVGYTSRSSFYSAFRKQFGMSPREYLMQRHKNSV